MNSHMIKYLIVVTITVITSFVTACTGSSSDSISGSTLDNSFSYPVRVQTLAGEHISNVNVTIDVAQKAPLNDVTDFTGFARIFVDTSYRDRPGTIVVDADGYIDA